MGYLDVDNRNTRNLVICLTRYSCNIASREIVTSTFEVKKCMNKNINMNTEKTMLVVFFMRYLKCGPYTR